jgi:broad-specificity NMP kinase
MEHLLLKIKEQLRKEQEARKYSEEKVKEFIEARTEEYEARASEPRRQEVNVTVSRPNYALFEEIAGKIWKKAKDDD